MKAYLLLGFFLIFSFIKINAQTDNVTLKFKTSAICEMCKETIERKLAYTKGIKSADLDLESKEKVITITYNSKKTNPETIKKTISELGYKADDVLANAKSYEKLPDCCKSGSKCD
ncbi:MAG: heavy-metal-associated domain-containing protein [Pseudarcicella sp.]|nr:heavy-metal-associated domain-containing protein [Pseudarcicella sp.]